MAADTDLGRRALGVSIDEENYGRAGPLPGPLAEPLPELLMRGLERVGRRLAATHDTDADAFADAGVEVRFMDYRCLPYPQLHGACTP